MVRKGERLIGLMEGARSAGPEGSVCSHRNRSQDSQDCSAGFPSPMAAKSSARVWLGYCLSLQQRKHL